MGELSQADLEKVKNVDLNKLGELIDEKFLATDVKSIFGGRGFQSGEDEQNLGTCNAVYMVEGKPVECGGKMVFREIHQPFDYNTPIGGNYRAPVIDSYAECDKCKIRKSL